MVKMYILTSLPFKVFFLSTLHAALNGCVVRVPEECGSVCVHVSVKYCCCFFSSRPLFVRGGGTVGRGTGLLGRGAGMVGRTFDARQKIGTSDIRQRLGGSGGKYPDQRSDCLNVNECEQQKTPNFQNLNCR